MGAISFLLLCVGGGMLEISSESIFDRGTQVKGWGVDEERARYKGACVRLLSPRFVGNSTTYKKTKNKIINILLYKYIANLLFAYTYLSYLKYTYLL